MDDSIRISLGDDFVPPKSDIVIKIDFLDDSSPARVFDMAANMVRAFEDLDRVLIGTIDSKIQTQLVLEDLQRSSIKIFLRNILEATDDQAIKELDWKPAVGKYLVKGKYAAIEWLDKAIESGDPAGIEDLTDKIRDLAEEADVRHLPDYPPINPSRLAQPMDEIQRVKAQFRSGEKLTITLGENEYQCDTSRTWLPSEHINDVAGDKTLSNDIDMVLVIRKPDFLGATEWQFQHGKKRFSAPIKDEIWLNSFRAGEHPLKPGDALRVRVRYTYIYDAKGDLLESDEEITKVLGIIKASTPPKGLFDEKQ